MAGPGSTLPLVGKGGMVLPRKLLVVPRKDRRRGGEGTEAPGPSSDPCRRETHLSQKGKQTVLVPGLGFMLASDRRVEAAERPRRPNMMSFLESKKVPTAHVGKHSRRFHPPGPQGKQEPGGGNVPSVGPASE